jgi:hypothetical protein
MGQPWTNLRWSDLQHARRGRRGHVGKELARRCSVQVSLRDAGKKPTQCCCAPGTAFTGSGREPPPRAPPGTAAPGSMQLRLPRSAGKETTFARSARWKRKERVASGRIRSGARRCIEIWPGFGARSSSPGRGARAQGGVYKTLGNERGQGLGEGREEEEEDPRRPHLAGVVSAGEIAGGDAVAAPRTAASVALGVAIHSEWRERGARWNGCKE